MVLAEEIPAGLVAERAIITNIRKRFFVSKPEEVSNCREPVANLLKGYVNVAVKLIEEIVEDVLPAAVITVFTLVVLKDELAGFSKANKEKATIYI